MIMNIICNMYSVYSILYKSYFGEDMKDSNIPLSTEGNNYCTFLRQYLDI